MANNAIYMLVTCHTLWFIESQQRRWTDARLARALTICREVRLEWLSRGFRHKAPNALPPNFELLLLPHFQPSSALIKLKRGLSSVMSPRVRPKGSFNPSHRSQLCSRCMHWLLSELLWIEVSTVWHMPLAVADLQLRDPGLNSGEGEPLSKSERKFSH